MADVIDMNGHRPGKSGSGSQRVTPEQATALLTACLALVRPVGMTEDETEDWLGVAVGEVLGFSLPVLDRACADARRTCTHHSQIIPAVIAAAEADTFRAPAEFTTAWIGYEGNAVPKPRLPAPKLTQENVDAMSPELRSIGLKCGALVERFGKIVVAPDADG